MAIITKNEETLNLYIKGNILEGNIFYITLNSYSIMYVHIIAV